MEQQRCDLLLLQDSSRKRDGKDQLQEQHGADWIKLWEGRRATDDAERFRLYQRVK